MKKLSRPQRVLKKFGKLAIGACICALSVKSCQNKRNKERLDIDHVVSIENMKTSKKVEQLIATTLYSNQIYEKVIHITEEPTSGIVHLYKPSLKSLEEAKENIQQIRKQQQIPSLISVDLEGGSVNHFQLSVADLKRFKMPAEIIEMRKREINYFNKQKNKNETIYDEGKSVTPSQEWIGKEYEKIKKNKKSKALFLENIKKYGECMANICEYVGINIVLAPCLDRVEDIDGDKHIEHQDRSYGENYKSITELALAYISGFDNKKTVRVAPKHFVGNGISKHDPHNKVAKINKDPHKGTSILPFRDVIKKGKDKYKNKDKFLKGNELDFIMSSNIATNFYEDNNTPTMYSKGAIRSLKTSKKKGGLGFNGLVITDDIGMKSSKHHLKNIKQKHSIPLSLNELGIWESLKSGNDIAFKKNISGSEIKKISEKIGKLIEQRADLDKDGKPDISIDFINKSLSKLLDLKVKMGLINSMKFEGEKHYILNPLVHEPTDWSVFKDSFLSNQWPGTLDDEDYKNENRKPVNFFSKQSAQLLYKAL